MGKVREAPLSQAHGRVRKGPARCRGRGARRIREVGWQCCPGALMGRLLLLEECTQWFACVNVSFGLRETRRFGPCAKERRKSLSACSSVRLGSWKM